MDSFLSLLLPFFLGGLLVANIPFLQRLLSFEEFFLGLQRGLAKGEEIRRGKGEGPSGKSRDKSKREKRK